MKNKDAFQIVVASTVGPYHKARGLDGQDCFACMQNKGRVVAVVSDGAGSAKHGKIGAKYICEKICEVLMKADFKNIRQNVVDAIEYARDELMMHRLNKTKNENGLIVRPPWSGRHIKTARACFFISVTAPGWRL